MSEVNLRGFDIDGAVKIGIPKGDDRNPCVEAFQEATDIEVPDFEGRRLKAVSQGREFFLLKGKDMAGLAAHGIIDLGATGTDSYETGPNYKNIRCQRIGDAMCQLVLMSEASAKESVEARLNADPRYRSAVMPVATPLPEQVNLFAASRDLPLRAVELPSGMTISGSMEIMPELLRDMGAELVADRVESGQTARENGLVRIMPMLDIYPALVQGLGNENL